MKIYYAILWINRNIFETKIFDKKFIELYRNKCKIIYESKIHQLGSSFKIKRNRESVLKIKLICFGTLKYPRELIFERNFSLVPVHFFERKIKKNNIMKDKFYLKYLFYNTSKMVYNIKPSKNRTPLIDDYIKIFGEKFVDNNSNKCAIKYKNEIFQLQECFKIKGIEILDNKLEIFLLQFKETPNKSYMFYECKALEEFSLVKENQDELIEERLSEKNKFNAENWRVPNFILVMKILILK